MEQLAAPGQGAEWPIQPFDPSRRFLAESTTFVGRVSELAEVVQFLESSRLVTLVGVGGVGKTRLALHACRAAARVQGRFPDGMWLVELAGLPDPGLLSHAVAAVLPLHDQSTRPMPDVLADYVSDRQLLLLLDTCETQLEACADTAQALLRAGPGLRILATSRQSLGIADEHVVTVGPLGVPDGEADLEAPGEAVSLLVDRAATAVPGFTLTSDNASAVGQLCRRLEGNPLAIELAASRLRSMSVEEIITHLDDRFQLVRGADMAGRPRQRALRTTIGWSHELCSPAERVLWPRLAVFPADFDASAAAAVCAGTALPATMVVDVLEGLVSRSVVLAVPTCGPTRYRLLDTVREFAREWLDALGETDRVRRRHRDHYLHTVERAEAQWFGPNQPGIMAALELERANTQAALDYCLTSPAESGTGLRLGGALWFYWKNNLAEGRQWLDRALHLSHERGRHRVRALFADSLVCVMQGDLPAAATLARQGLNEARRCGDRGGAAHATARLGAIAMLDGELRHAEGLLRTALRTFEALGELNGLVLIDQVSLAAVLCFQGRPEEARTVAEGARAVCVAHGETEARAHACYVLTLIAMARGDLTAAAGYAAEGVRQHHTLGHVPGAAMHLEMLAWLAPADASNRTAVLHGAAQRMWRATGQRLYMSPRLNAVHAECEARARGALGEAAYEAAFGRGAGLDLATAVAYAVGDRPWVGS